MNINPSDIQEQTKCIQRFSILERLDELKRISESDKGASNFDGWDYLDKRMEELQDQLKS